MGRSLLGDALERSDVVGLRFLLLELSTMMLCMSQSKKQLMVDIDQHRQQITNYYSRVLSRKAWRLSWLFLVVSFSMVTALVTLWCSGVDSPRSVFVFFSVPCLLYP